MGLAALLAIPAYVCAQGATPFAAVLMHKGASLGAGVAFLLVGPGSSPLTCVGPGSSARPECPTDWATALDEP